MRLLLDKPPYDYNTRTYATLVFGQDNPAVAQMFYFGLSPQTESAFDENTVPNNPEGEFIIKQEGIKVKAGTPLFSSKMHNASIEMGVKDAVRTNYKLKFGDLKFGDGPQVD